MENNTHGEFIQLGENVHAFVDGIPDECDHKWDGDVIYYSASGERITPYTYPKWTAYTSQMRDPLIHKHHQDIDDPILSGTVTCSKCGKECMP